jgi:Putative virion core protein (lumpy skin disease virus)
LDKIINLPFGGKTPFVAEVWFVNKVIRRGLKFGTPNPIRVIDPRYAAAEMAVPVSAHGDYSIRISDSLLLLNEFVGTQHLFTSEDFVSKFSTMILQEINKHIKSYSREQLISPLDFPEYAPEIADFIKNNLADRFSAYGICIEDFQFAHLAPNENDPVVKELYNNRLEAVKERERRQIQGFTYQQERQLDIMETAAGNEGSAGNVMGAGIGMGMGFGIGNAFNQQASQMAGAMNNNQTPPPPPTSFSPYYIFANNVQQGPFDMVTLKTLVQNGMLTPQTLVWKQGMSAWGEASAQPDLAHLFSATPPPPPPVMP